MVRCYVTACAQNDSQTVQSHDKIARSQHSMLYGIRLMARKISYQEDQSPSITLSCEVGQNSEKLIKREIYNQPNILLVWSQLSTAL